MNIQHNYPRNSSRVGFPRLIAAVRFKTSHENSGQAKDVTARQRPYTCFNRCDEFNTSARSDNVSTILAEAPIANDPNSASRLALIRTRVRPALIAAILAVLIGCGPAVAQMENTTADIGTTSPLGMTAGTSVSPTGDGMGATELASPGLSPVPTNSIGITGIGVACPAPASSSAGLSGTGTTYDGGGMTMGTLMIGGTPTSGTCASGSAASPGSSAMSIASPGIASPAGIPLGSVETTDSGLSPVPVSPMPGLIPSPMPGGMVAGSSAYPSLTAAPTTSAAIPSGSSAFTPAVGVGGPCAAIGTSVSSASSTGC